jgi:hypothetical protein
MGGAYITAKGKKKTEAREKIELLIKQGAKDYEMVVDQEPVIVYDRKRRVWIAECTLHT